MPTLLLLETATDICSVGISRDDQLLSLVEIGERADHAARINELILEAAREAGVTLPELDAVVISKGPGSFTSLRVGTATAKGICFALDKPMLAIDTLTSIAHAAHLPGPERRLYCPMIDARRMEVYTAFYDQDLRPVKPIHPLIVDAHVFDDYLRQGYQIMIAGNGAEKCLTVLPETVHLLDIRCSASHLLSPALSAYREGRFEDLAYFEPQYLKSPNITTPRKRLL